VHPNQPDFRNPNTSPRTYAEELRSAGFRIRTNFSFPFELSHLIAGMPYRAPIDKDRVFVTMFNAPPGGATVE
jgi:hypothetical protein